jgi:hypothetical protein
MTAIVAFLLMGLPQIGPVGAAVEQEAVGPTNLLEKQRQRAIVEEQKMTQRIEESLRQARREFPIDPDSAVDTLRSMLFSVKDHPDLRAEVRDKMVTHLQNALRDTAARARASKLANYDLTMSVQAKIAKAGRIYHDYPKKALKLLRVTVLEVWDHPNISERHREKLLARLVAARVDLTKDE